MHASTSQITRRTPSSHILHVWHSTCRHQTPVSSTPLDSAFHSTIFVIPSPSTQLRGVLHNTWYPYCPSIDWRIDWNRKVKIDDLLATTGRSRVGPDKFRTTGCSCQARLGIPQPCFARPIIRSVSLSFPEITHQAGLQPKAPLLDTISPKHPSYARDADSIVIRSEYRS